MGIVLYNSITLKAFKKAGPQQKKIMDLGPENGANFVSELEPRSFYYNFQVPLPQKILKIKNLRTFLQTEKCHSSTVNPLC